MRAYADMRAYTHGGRFHADEVLACAILKEYCWITDQHLEIRRLDDISEIPDDGKVLDIGREYDGRRLFDHHQAFLTRDDGYPLATAGLIWRRYGRQCLEDRTYHVEQVWQMVDDRFIKGVDAHDADSGYYATGYCHGGDVSVLTFSQIIAYMNNPNLKKNGANFEKALSFAWGEVLDSVINQCIESVNGIVRVQEADLKDAGGNKYYQFDEFFPWHEGVCATEADYVIMPSAHPGNPISVLAVPVRPGIRDLRRPISRPEWFTNFIHEGEWIAGCASTEEAIKLIADQ